MLNVRALGVESTQAEVQTLQATTRPLHSTQKYGVTYTMKNSNNNLSNVKRQIN